MSENTPDASAPSGRRLAMDVHGRVRRMILDGELLPGQQILQAELARRLGVSRTPLREAFRLLQEEGLIDASPDKRATVRAVDPGELDAVYASRILLEATAVDVTVRNVSNGQLSDLREALAEMREQADAGAAERWRSAHREFHRLCAHGVAPYLRSEIDSLGERGERYLRIALQGGGPREWARADHDHAALVEAFDNRDPDAATGVLARHLARTAFVVIADLAPEYDPVLARTALGLVIGRMRGAELAGNALDKSK